MDYLIKALRIEYGEELAEQAASVVRVVKNKIVSKNLFGWRTFIEDVLVDAVNHMIKTEFRYSGGAYVAVGMQIAVDATRYCNAQKRRGNYETVSLDEIAHFIPDSRSEYNNQLKDFIEDIADVLDEDTTSCIRDFLSGRRDNLSKEVIKKCKTPEFEAWLKDYRK